MENAYFIDPDIRKAATLPGGFYSDKAAFETIKKTAFLKSWQYICHQSELPDGAGVFPFRFLPGFLDIPLIFTKNVDGELRCLSNVCTHRGYLLTDEPKSCKGLTCKYHGRKFGLNGRFQSMPEFEETANFPSKEDDLKQVSLYYWQGLLFAAIDPELSFEEWAAPMISGTAGLPFQNFKTESRLRETYSVQAHWALYCDNYLEGFHIPFVHPALNKILDYGAYSTELYPWASLQAGVGKPGEQLLPLPADNPWFEKNITALYYWLFPNQMFNFYPWGVSINVVLPYNCGSTLVDYHGLVWDQAADISKVKSTLHTTEMEDEEVVEGVQAAIFSPLYSKGRFSPSREQGVHHFHRLIVNHLSKDKKQS